MDNRFLQALHSGRVLLMDGAMGTELQRAGLREGECCEQWNLSHPEQVLAIHRAYADAGAEVLLTNTFQANPPTLVRHGLEKQLLAICEAGVNLARTATNSSCFILGDVTPFDDSHKPRIPIHFLQPWKQADGVLVETCSDVIPSRMTAVGLLKAMIQPGQFWLPVLISFTYHRDDHGELRTFHGFKPDAVARRTPDFAALGVNCGRNITIDDCAEIIRRYRTVTDLPLFARPNAGTPTKINDQWVYPHTPEQMAADLPKLLEAGVSMIGGCCGTTPAHIAAFRKVVDEWNAQKQTARS